MKIQNLKIKSFKDNMLSGADLVKYAMVLIRKEIIQNDLPVKMVLQVHDEVVTMVHKNYSEQWKKEIVKIMEKAAMSVVDTGLLKAEAKISPVWAK